MIDLILIVLFQAAAGDPAPAAQSPATPEASEAQPTDGAQGQPAEATEERQICRREIIIGTRMTQRVCRTVSQEREAEREARDFTQRMQSQNPLTSN